VMKRLGLDEFAFRFTTFVPVFSKCFSERERERERERI
jgi:hypothetical protein